MKLKAIIFCLAIAFHFNFNAQTDPFKYYVDTLCSPFFKGRGYVDEGHLKAAKFIENEFLKFGLSTLNQNSFLQDFNINVNTFPRRIKIVKDGDQLREGVDFIIDPSSCSLNGKFKVKIVNLENYKFILNDFDYKSEIFLIDASKLQNKDSISLFKDLSFKLAKFGPTIFIQNSKLTWSVSSAQKKHPIIYITKGLDYSFNSIFEINFDAELKRIQTNNVCGFIEGRSKKIIVISAHYDHLGMMGSSIFPGANDNASGVSLLLNLANYYSSKKNKYDMVFLCFGAEEIGLVGSNYFVNNPLIPLKNIKFLINLDIVGTGQDGIAIVNAIDQKRYVKKIGDINKDLKLFSKIKIRGQAPNSDHYFFSTNDIPAIFIYTLGGINAYHDVFDKSETLPLTKISNLFILINTFLKHI
tara:strand:+ start:8117 stop:9355 length:1239 start_codon:yes stop_codon:yes gene_type:complete